MTDLWMAVVSREDRSILCGQIRSMERAESRPWNRSVHQQLMMINRIRRKLDLDHETMNLNARPVRQLT